MQFAAVSLSLFVAFVAAQNSTSSLPDLVAQIPKCATSCFSSAAQDAQCAATDFTCLCGSGRDQFTSSITPCILIRSGCSQDDISTASTIAPEICNAISSNPDASAVAEASSIVTSVIGTATPTSTPGAAARPDVGLGLIGAAALAALAL
ncbi:hypothetical protein AAE478_010069 [Parahypoxylon ruwenzoriense]